MEFVTRNENATSNLSFRLKATLVQKKLFFFEVYGSITSEGFIFCFGRADFNSNKTVVKLQKKGIKLIKTLLLNSVKKVSISSVYYFLLNFFNYPILRFSY